MCRDHQVVRADNFPFPLQGGADLPVVGGGPVVGVDQGVRALVVASRLAQAGPNPCETNVRTGFLFMCRDGVKLHAESTHKL
jgi:hypothetical protein